VIETLLLPDGRTLGYAVTGDRDGPPVFYFHGWPASRMEAALIDSLPVRLIALDRPGYGASSPQRGRRLLDWPADVATLADHLGLRAFHAVGVSAGAPYALACAAVLGRVCGTALVSPLPPLAGAGAPLPDVLGRRLCWLRRLGSHARIGWAVMAGIRLGLRGGLVDPQKVIDGASSPRDASALTPERRRRLIEAWREGLRHGVAGAMSDARIFASPWNLDLDVIRTPVAIWHGTADLVVPAGTLSAYAALPAQRHMLEGEGHFSLALTRANEILTVLTGR
jgi:pimeloyl-ACP methyl ester carboxylesterase